MKGVNLLKSKPGYCKLEVDTTRTNIAEVIKQMDTENLIDINISNVPLEKIITEIYKEKEKN